jgi:NTE family protein
MILKNLAIKGGGVRGIAYVGALQVLEEKRLLEGIERVAGTSAGALVAGMLCAGYNSEQIHGWMRKLDFKKFKAGWNPFRILRSYGLYSGDYILHFIHSFLKDSPKKIQADTTFEKMADAGCKKLYTFACDLNLHAVSEFSVDKTPQVVVAEAIRASMSIPLFFKAWQFTDGIPNDHLYVDGGIAFNYPLLFFDDKRFTSNTDLICEEAFGLFLYDVNGKRKNNIAKNTPERYFKVLFETLMETQNIDFSFDSAEIRRTIIIDGLGVPATDFNLSEDIMDNLIASGRDCTLKFLEKQS